MSMGLLSSDIESVLVVKPSSLGDIVHTLPSVHLLKRARPDLKISWIVNNEWAPLLAENPDLEAAILFPRKGFRGVQTVRNLCDWAGTVRHIKPDLALDFQGLMRSTLIAKMSGARRIHCLADAEVTTRLLSHHVVPAIRSEEHAVTRYLRLVTDLGVYPCAPLEFPLPAGEKPQGVDLPRRYLLVHPFSRGENKSISAACLKRMFERMAPVPIVLVGRAHQDMRVPDGCVSLLNKTSLSGLIWLIRHAHFTLSVDSGPMHIAAAITGRLLGIHHWTEPMLVGPYNPDAWVWKDGRMVQMRDYKPMTGQESVIFGLEHIDEVTDFLKGKFAENGC
jgi:heptosyltransferase-1